MWLFPCIFGSSCSHDFLPVFRFSSAILQELEGGRFIEGEHIYWVVQFHWKDVSRMSRLHVWNAQSNILGPYIKYIYLASFIALQSSVVHKSTSVVPLLYRPGLRFSKASWTKLIVEIIGGSYSTIYLGLREAQPLSMQFCSLNLLLFHVESGCEWVSREWISVLLFHILEWERVNLPL